MTVYLYLIDGFDVESFMELLIDSDNEFEILLTVVGELTNPRYCDKLNLRPLRVNDQLSIEDKVYKFNGRAFDQIK